MALTRPAFRAIPFATLQFTGVNRPTPAPLGLRLSSRSRHSPRPLEPRSATRKPNLAASHYTRPLLNVLTDSSPQSVQLPTATYTSPVTPLTGSRHGRGALNPPTPPQLDGSTV